ncbi:MAG: hypothetical protein LAT62_11080 [Natronospirillum sp.]|uniref:hypothetical protein n=1 Tax=Natronospirillum sp. TaxID=2812955 RepID=UPI0025D16AC0|nr:hypothetical protein [Natronospirillum sp.]MCH8552472.1 hypothetical protein [Natronospirillum sp.]
MDRDTDTSSHSANSTDREAAYRELIIRTSMAFINLPLDQMDDAIAGALGEIGQFFHADRVYVFAYDFSRHLTRNTHEWCAEGIEPQIDNL